MKTLAVITSLVAVVLLAGCQEYTPLVSWTDSKDWTTPYGTGQRIESRHYLVYTTVRDDRVLTEFPAFMEAALQSYQTLTKLPDRPTGKPWPIYLMLNREQWVDLTRHELKDQAKPYLAITAGGYTHRGVGVFWWTPGTGMLSIAAHEGLHQFFFYRLRNHLPMWLEEGLCCVAEGFHYRFGGYVRFTPEKNDQRFYALRQAVSDVESDWFPLEELLRMDASDAIGTGDNAAVTYYAQVWALVRFCLSDENYSKGLYQLLADAEAGTLHTPLGVPEDKLQELQLRGKAYNVTVSRPLFEHYISKDLAAFETAYRQYAERDLAGIQWPPPSGLSVPGWNAP